jgi:HAD superfamily hydrolase (TIGR01484 family)
MSSPLRELRGPVRALFSDIDGTLTSQGRIEGATYVALEKLGEAGVPVVLVTGRPAGWGQAFMTVAPVAAVVTENGGLTFVREGRRLRKLYGVPPASLPEWRRRMLECASDVQREVPGARQSAVSKYPQVALRIDT